MHTEDRDEAVEQVARVFCPHTLAVEERRRRSLNLRLAVKHPTIQPLVELSYGAEVLIDTNVSRYFVMHCVRGSASTWQDGRSADWKKGQSTLFSAGRETRLRLDQTFATHAVMLDIDQLERQCSRWLGRPLSHPLNFAHQPFSEDLEHVWQQSLAYLWSIEGRRMALSRTARAAFDEYLLTLLLHQHPHNFSALLDGPVRSPVPGLVRRAERLMAEHAADAITVTDIADHLGVSLRSLQAGFRQWRNTTPTACLRQIRLQQVRDELLGSGSEDSVTSIALRYGFVHLGRFSAHYQSAFGEPPSATLRRRRSIQRGLVLGTDDGARRLSTIVAPPRPQAEES